MKKKDEDFIRNEDHEVIKLDFFMDFQELENELKKDEENSRGNYREEKQEKPENLTFPQKNQRICEGILEDLMKDFIEEPFITKQKEMLINSLSKRPHFPFHNKEFDSHFPKEDLYLIKSQEFRNFLFFLSKK